MYAKISTFTFIPISTEQLQWISGGKKEHVFLKRKKGSKERKKESDSNRIRFSVLAYLDTMWPKCS